MIEYENLYKLNAPFMAEYQKAFNAVLQSGWFILGQEVSSFEQEFAHSVGCAHTLGVANGLDALTMALKAFNFPSHSEVIVPSNTYIATILAILQSGLTPVLVEPELATYNIDPALIEEAITVRTKAIMVVHLYGKACAMDRIGALCQQYNLKLVEDAAQSHGACFKGQQTGTFGDYGCFSFYPTKNLGALGDGGAVTTQDAGLALAIKRMRNYGSDKKYYNEIMGQNSRLDEVQAAFLRVKLRSLEAITRHKRFLATLYHAGLNDKFIKPVVDGDYYDVYHIYNIRHERRDELKAWLARHEIGSEIHYPVPPHQQKAMSGLFKESYPISQEIHSTTLSLPISYFHTEADITRVIEVLNAF